MKPLHEQALTVFDGGGHDCQQAVLAEDGRMLAMTRADDGRDIAEFFAAAPDMARELKKATARCPMGCECGMCAALRKGGVIP